MLCNTCHPWVHSHPVLARGSGWIVSRYEAEPGAIPFLRANDLWVMPRCDGSELLASAGSLGEAIEEFGEMTEVEAEVYNFTQEQP